jgi:putrescine aminotransferase
MSKSDNKSGIARTTPSHDEYRAIDAAHHLHPFTDFKALSERGSRVITHAKGVYLFDADGHRILDGMAGLWCVNLGYGRTELIDAAAAQMHQLAYYNNFFNTSHPPAIELAQRLAQLAPQSMRRVFFTNSGSEANDTVVRMVRRYWELRGQPARNIIISRKNAYHGSTIASGSLGGMAAMHAQGGLPIPDIEHIEQPYWYALGGSMNPDEFGLRAANWLRSRIEAIGTERIAAFIAEPIQGAGGVIVPPDSYWPAIGRICREFGILLVADEVICGFGRLGHWFGSQYYGIEADLLSFAKGLSSGYLPIGGVMLADSVADVLIEQGGEFHHGFTSSGHPTCAALAIENIDILHRERIIERVRDDTGPYFQSRLRELLNHDLVGEVRGVGMMAAIQLCANKERRTPFAQVGAAGLLCRDHSFRLGLVMRAVDDSMILSPPLIISHEEIDELLDKAHSALDCTLTDLHRQGLLQVRRR